MTVNRPLSPRRRVATIPPAFFLSPFDALSDPGFPLRVINRWGLAPGERVDVHTASYGDSAWVEPGMLTVSEDGAELEGGDVPVISPIALIRPSL